MSEYHDDAQAECLIRVRQYLSERQTGVRRPESDTQLFDQEDRSQTLNFSL